MNIKYAVSKAEMRAEASSTLLKGWRVQNNMHGLKFSNLNRDIVENPREQRAFKVAIRINGC